MTNKDGRNSILAKDAKEKMTYVTAMGKKIEIKKINYFSGSTGEVSSVTVLAENSSSPITISGATELYTIDAQALPKEKEITIEDTETQATTPITDSKPAKNEKEVVNEKITKSSIKKDEAKMKESENTAPTTPPAEKQPKMSDVINPMIFDGKPAEEIADAVMAQFPAKFTSGDTDEAKATRTAERSKLIQQIKGPRTYNLKTRYPEKFPQTAPEATQGEVPAEAPKTS